jgi:hypothetical protein
VFLHLFWFQRSSFDVSIDCANLLIDKMILLIVKKKQRVDELSDKVVEVIRVTDDIEIINRYNFQGNNFTPTKVCDLAFVIVLLIFCLTLYHDQSLKCL